MLDVRTGGISHYCEVEAEGGWARGNDFPYRRNLPLGVGIRLHRRPRLRCSPHGAPDMQAVSQETHQGASLPSSPLGAYQCLLEPPLVRLATALMQLMPARRHRMPFLR